MTPQALPCDDPFWERCVHFFGRHLGPAIQRRWRKVWAARKKARAAERIERLRPAAVEEHMGFLHDLSLLRKPAGLTQTALAAKVGVTANAIARIERGELRPRPTVTRRLRQVLDGSRIAS